MKFTSNRFLASVLAALGFVASTIADPFVYVAGHSDDRVVVFDLSTGGSQTVVQTQASAGSKYCLVEPVTGDVLVGLRFAPFTVQRFSSDGTFIGDVTPGIGSLGPGEFELHGADTLIVATGGGKDVKRYSLSSGALIDSFTPDGCCNVHGLALDGDLLYVGESQSPRITRFDLTAQPAMGVVIVDSADAQAVFEDMFAIEIGPNGDLFVFGRSIDGRGIVAEFDPADGSYVGEFADLFSLAGNTNGAGDIRFNETTSTFFVTARTSELFEFSTSGMVLGTYSTALLNDARGVAFGANPFGPLGDLNGDGLVNGADLAALLAAWGPCDPSPAPCAADISGSGDGVVNGGDLAVLLANWQTSASN